MALIIRNITLSLDDPEDVLLNKAASRLGVGLGAIAQYAVVRRSLDARRDRELQYVYTVELALADGPRAERACLRRLHGRNVELLEPPLPHEAEPGQAPLPHQPVIVGFGPAGIFAALRLAEMGYCPIVLERGCKVRQRHRDIMHTFYREGRFNPESNLLFGEGGAGTYSDGKVYTRLSEPMVRDVLGILVRFGADPDVFIDGKPHIGSDRLPTICTHIREHIERLGGEVRFETRVDDFEIEGGALAALTVRGERMPVGPVLLGIGHSARDTYRQLAERGVRMDAKPFQIGVRIEHPQELVDRWQYGSACGHPKLPPADYHLVSKRAAGERRDLFSFCMCPGGQILPTNESDGLIATNGASRASRSGRFANSGLVVTVDPSDVGGDALAGLEFQRKWERLAFNAVDAGYRVPAQRCVDFLADRTSDGVLETSYPLGGKWTRIAEIVPDFLVSALRSALPRLDQRMPGFAGGDGVITAPETRASAPVRIVRDSGTRVSVSTGNLYPIGEGAGYAGGIVSAAIDGIKSAEAVIRQYKPVR